MKIRIKQGKRLNADFTWQESASIDLVDGLISHIDDSSRPVDQEIDAQGCWILPGLTDLNVSLREPGFTAKGSVDTETLAALAGGVTRLCCSPETGPVNDSRAVTKLIKELAAQVDRSEVLPLGALTKGLQGEFLSEYSALKTAGCIALSNAYHPIKNLSVTKRCFEYARTHNLSVFLNPIEESLHKGSMHEGHISTTIGLQGISSLSETIAVAQLLQLADATGVHLHLAQLSCAEAVEQVRQAKVNGILVTADVALQNLLFTDANTESFASVFHCMPPLREESDRLALLKGVQDGTLDAITSAHQPHEAAAKQMPFAETEPGMSMVEFILPLAQWLDEKNELPFADFIRAMTVGSARVIQQPCRSLCEGQQADIVIYDPSAERVIGLDDILSRGKNSPLLGAQIKGQTRSTFFKGRLVYQS